jgi:hypothetical protein
MASSSSASTHEQCYVVKKRNIANILMSSGKNIREQLINFAAMQRTCQRPACSGIHSAIQSSYCLACFPWDFNGVITAINLCHHADYGLLRIFQMSSYSKTQCSCKTTQASCKRQLYCLFILLLTKQWWSPQIR